MSFSTYDAILEVVKDILSYINSVQFFVVEGRVSIFTLADWHLVYIVRLVLKSVSDKDISAEIRRQVCDCINLDVKVDRLPKELLRFLD